MKRLSTTVKRCGAIFGVLILSALVIFLFGNVVAHTQVDEGEFTTIDGAFVSFAPASAQLPLSILDLLGYIIGLGGSGGVLLASVPFALSLIAGVLLVLNSTIQRTSSRLLRYFVIAVYCATPVLAVIVVFMLLYAVATLSPAID